jgi:hypothetical protein
MNKFTITDPIKAIEAGEWCNENLGQDGWDLWAPNVLSNNPKYEFRIHDDKQSTLFSLVWSEYV